MTERGIEDLMSDSASHSSPINPKEEESLNKTNAFQGNDEIGVSEEMLPLQQWKRDNLFLEIPSRALMKSPSFVKINLPPTPSPRSSQINIPPMSSSISTQLDSSSSPSAFRGKPSVKNLLTRLSFKLQSPTSDIEKAGNLVPGPSTGGLWERPPTPTAFSLTKIFTPAIKRTSSLPVNHIPHSNPGSLHGSSATEQNVSPVKGGQRHISRSVSMPLNNKTKTIRRMNSLAAGFRVIPSTARPKEQGGVILDNAGTADHENTDGGQDIPEEQAVCRICLIELDEGGDTLKMECSCKGELALAHQECAVKWFGIKGNNKCDVCKEEVQNLSVTLLRIQSVRTSDARAGSRGAMTDIWYRIWQDVPVVVIVGILAYFCFIEQLLVADLGSGAVAMALPFSCVLGLLASITSSTMVRQRYVWLYASIQFALVVLFAHLFYSLFHVQAVLSVFLATLAGFGLAMCGNLIVIQFFRWRRMLRARQSRPQASRGAQELGQQSQNVVPPGSGLTETRGSTEVNL